MFPSGGDSSAPPGAAPRKSTEELRPHASERSVQTFRLRSGEGHLYTSTEEKTVIGTHPSADLVLDDPTVSRFHCEIVFENDRPLLRDLNSLNGTFVDSVSVLAAWLSDASVLRLGRTRLRFELRPEHSVIHLSRRSRFGSLVGVSPAMRRAFALLERASQTDATLVLTGETGTGKDGAARAVHEHSERRRGPFVVVDCGAIPADLLESQLFGHLRGAFTGAALDREGAFSRASGGTLFLDEIGELGLDLQPKLLRVLETKEVQPLGGDRRVPIDVRIIAATSRNLRALVNERAFRSDLYYRLAVLEVEMPPLRDRKEDIGPLVEHLVASSTSAQADPARADEVRSHEFIGELGRHSWPGNVRELRNYVERCLVLGLGTPFRAQESTSVSGLSVDVSRKLRAERERWLEHLERWYLEELLRRHAQNVSEAARQAGIHRAHFYRLLSKRGLR